MGGTILSRFTLLRLGEGPQLLIIALVTYLSLDVSAWQNIWQTCALHVGVWGRHGLRIDPEHCQASGQVGPFWLCFGLVRESDWPCS